MDLAHSSYRASLPRDLTAGLVVFLVALPLCLGVALASNAPLFSGVLAGIAGGVLVGLISGSHTSVSGPAAGLTAVVAAEIATLGSFQTFLLAVLLAGLIQIALGIARAGFVAAFFPSSVIKGLLAAIGVILVLKQVPHVLGHDADPEDDMAFLQPDHENTFSEFGRILGDIHPSAALIGLASIALLLVWDRTRTLKRSGIPAPLVVVLGGVAACWALRLLGGRWVIGPSHLVQVPVADSLGAFLGFLQTPDFSQWANPAVYTAALTIAAVASLETLLNLEAIDRLDPWQRASPPSRELVAQGIGNVVCGLIGGLPVTSVVVRSSVNLNSGGRTKVATVVHGLLLLTSVLFFPVWLNAIPLSCLAAILLVTGVKLASPALVRRMWQEGRYQFIPFALTVVAIVLTDLLIGVLIGLAVSIGFILRSNVKRPLRRVLEKHLGGEVVHIELANQVSFLNRAALNRAFNEVPRGGHLLLDAQNTDYFDPDILNLIRDFQEKTAPARGIEVSLVGFRRRYQLENKTQYIDYSTREIQDKLTPEGVLQLLKEGHERFRTGRRLTRDLIRQISATADGQHPLAVVLSCIDSRTPVELIFDVGLGEVLSVRIAGNVVSPGVLGSVEYGCEVAGAKLVLVMGHTRCGAVTAAVNRLVASASTPGSEIEIETETESRGHLDRLVAQIQQSVDTHASPSADQLIPSEMQTFIDTLSRRHVARTVAELVRQSHALARLVDEGRVAVVGAVYDVATGGLEFLPESEVIQALPPEAPAHVATAIARRGPQAISSSTHS